MREWSIISSNNHPSNPHQPIHSLLSTSKNYRVTACFFVIQINLTWTCVPTMKKWLASGVIKHGSLENPPVIFLWVGKTMPFLPAMTGNGNHTTYKNGEVGDGLLFWLVVSNMNFIFHNTWDNPSHWRIHIFQDGKTTNQYFFLPTLQWISQPAMFDTEV